MKRGKNRCGTVISPERCADGAYIYSGKCVKTKAKIGFADEKKTSKAANDDKISTEVCITEKNKSNDKTDAIMTRGGEMLKEETKGYKKSLAAIQQELKDAKIPVIVLVEGFATSGKGTLINELISEMDPRFVSVKILDHMLKERDRYPFLYPYYNTIPENGKIYFLDSGWMEEAVRDAVHEKTDKKEFGKRIEEIRGFERQLRDNGYVVIKYFLTTDKKTQEKRQRKLREDGNTDWRVSKQDLYQNDRFDTFAKKYEEFMAATNDVNPWVVINTDDKKEVFYTAFKHMYEVLTAQLEAGKYNGEPYEAEFDFPEETPKLEDADLRAFLDDSFYKDELKKLQSRLGKLHSMIYRRRIPVVLCFEGWDAAGKGGNIKRIAYPLDPRGFDIYPIASPSPEEKNRHHLWRFWNKVPRTGHVAIFDRTWYGRVMVERIEGFCTENDWKRAYAEINEFEKNLTDWGAVVLKFWIHIDSDTQLERFTLRQNTPEKQWKITDEDWRNRDKWPQYEEAIGEMIAKTSTNNAPWYIIESKDKKYARIKTLRIICESLEKAIDEFDRK